MTSQVDVDMSAAEGARTEFNARQPDQMRTTALAFIARAATALLTSHPRLNASLIEGALRQWNTVNLGIAVDAPHGLIVPVIRGAGALGVSELAREIWRLATAARERRLRLEDVAGPTFTISNPGALGAVEAPAIIDLPQVATLGMAAIVRTPKVIIDSYGREAIAIRPILRAALTYDHRALNGGEAARYLTDLRNALESWSLDQYL
jgi:2-oxoglutarate dehydrogenase E2 component (dihydrolipoamide succinyltransferase)